MRTKIKLSCDRANISSVFGTFFISLYSGILFLKRKQKILNKTKIKKCKKKFIRRYNYEKKKSLKDLFIFCC